MQTSLGVTFFSISFLLSTGISVVSKDHERFLWDVAWSPDGQRVAVGGEYAFWVFDADDWSRIDSAPQIKAPENLEADTSYIAVTSLKWNPVDPSALATSSQGAGRSVNGIYEFDGGDFTTVETDGGRGVAWSPDGEFLAGSSPGDGHLRIWKRDGSLVANVPRGENQKGLTGVAWSPDGERMVTIGNNIQIRDPLGVILQSWDHRPDDKGRLNLLLGVEWHPSGEFFAICDYGNNVDFAVIQFWSAEGELLRTMAPEGASEIRNIAWTKKGDLLASGGDKLRIWSKAGDLLHQHSVEGIIWGVSWNPDGSRIVTVGHRTQMELWNHDATPIRTIDLGGATNPELE